MSKPNWTNADLVRQWLLRSIGGRIGEPMTAVDTLLTLLLEDTRNVAARMVAAGFSEDEIRGAWIFRRHA